VTPLIVAGAGGPDLLGVDQEAVEVSGDNVSPRDFKTDVVSRCQPWEIEQRSRYGCST
jgi:hypothetical protein